MAQTELAPGTNPATRQLAQQIITSQQAEIGENAAAATAKLIDTVVGKHSAPLCGALPLSRVGVGAGCGHVCCDCGCCGS